VFGDKRGTAAGQAERIVAFGFVSARAAQIAFSALMVVIDRRKYSRPKIQGALLAGTVLESAWLARRILRSDSYQDPAGRVVDTVWASVGMLVCEAALGEGSATPWMKNVAIGAAVGAAISDNPVEQNIQLGILCSSAFISGLRAKGRDSHVAGAALAVNDVINWSGQHLAVRTYLATYRRQARLRDEADRRAVELAAERTASEERIRQHRLVHNRTAAVLRSLAETDDIQLASASARLEASRLRQLLRSRGEMPKDLEAALSEAAELARTDGLHIELVTAELVDDTSAETAASAWEAVHATLQAAKQCVPAGRVVIRAVSDPDWVTVTIRHQFTGVDKAVSDEYVERLGAVDRSLESAGGHAEVWSGEGRGVRVTIVVPVAASSDGHRHQPSEGVPDGSSRRRPASHDDGSLDEGHLHVGLFGGLVGGTHDDVNGSFLVGNAELGPGRQTFEAGAEQGFGRHDPRQRRAADDALGIALAAQSSHTPRMTKALGHVLGRNIQFGRVDEPPTTKEGESGSGVLPDELTRIRRALATMFLTWRFSGLATGLAALVAGRRSYHSAAGAAALVLGGTVESGWIAKRLIANGYRFDGLVRSVDVATAVGLLVGVRNNLGREHRWTWLNWAPWSFAAATVCLCADDMENLRVGPAGTAVICGSCGLLADRWADRLVNPIGLAGMFVVARPFFRRFFTAAEQIERSRVETIEEEQRIAIEQERFRQMRLLHDSALQTLEAVGSGRIAEPALVRAMALEEATLLEHELEGDRSIGTLAQEISGVIDLQMKRGLEIDLRADDRATVAPQVLAALRDACNESLTNVRKHAGTNKASVEVAVVTGGVQVTIADQGVGFDPLGHVGFGMPQSIRQRMTDVGGTSEVDSAPGSGTRVVLWGPA
jgi:signal transduction histidine kinase